MPPASFFGWKPLEVPGNPKVSLAIAAYQRVDPLACFLYSLKSQTYDNWEVVIVHDGAFAPVRKIVESIDDPRIKLIETEERKGHYGHPWRKRGIEACTGDFIGLSNDDNWYAPVYFEWMLHQLVTTQSDFAYCDMVHSHYQWKFFPTKTKKWKVLPALPRKGTLDLAAWIARAEIVRATPWTDIGFDGDGTFIEDLLTRTKKVAHVPGCLLVHN